MIPRNKKIQFKRVYSFALAVITAMVGVALTSSTQVSAHAVTGQVRAVLSSDKALLHAGCSRCHRHRGHCKKCPPGARGPKGDRGDRGPKGDRGEQGPPGLAGYEVNGVGYVVPPNRITYQAITRCSPGKVVLGGGYSSGNPAVDTSQDTATLENDGWAVTFNQSHRPICVG
ncbi:hypothetical protein GCM10020219_071310 [Nonomuraea dietziae]